MNNLDFAQRYIEDFDFAVFPLYAIENGKCTCGKPCTSPGKHPQTSTGFKAASKNLSDFKHVWTQNDSNIGIATGDVSKIIVLDVDPKNGGTDSLKELIKEIGDFTTYTIKTGSGGLHFYFEYPHGFDIGNSANLLGKGLDIRGRGGYVVAPPSNHLQGNYEIVENSKIIQLPDKLLKLLIQPKTNNQPNNNQPINNDDGIRANGSQPYTSPDNIAQGNRNNELTRLAGSLRRAGLSELAIASALKVENLRICKPPLDDIEIQSIAYSVSRYTPDTILQAISDDPTLKNNQQAKKITTTGFWTLGDFLKQKIPPRDVIGFHLAKKEWGILAAKKNVGKTTFLRNASMMIACGKEFAPFYEDTKPRKVLYLDFESTREMLFPDMKLMLKEGEFTVAEIELIKENFCIIHKGLVDGELLTMQNTMQYLEVLCKKEKIDFVMVDNLSAAFQVLDESSSGVMNQKVVQPVLKFIEMADVALMMVHHSGKSNTNDSYAGRGSSILEDLAPVGFKMDGNTHTGEAVTISNVKRKDGQGYEKVFKLNYDRRWFESTTIAPKAKPMPTYLQIERFVQKHQFPDTVSTKEINQKFPHLDRRHISKRLSELVRDNYISRPKQGQFCDFIPPKK